ncbi:restriction endonuclease subunit S [Helicobacter pylori]|nr:restriction endonuclease subunit S [Helicobacter pylori]
MHKIERLLQTLAPKGVEFRKLGDIGEFYSGLVGKSKKSFSQGNKFYVPYVNVFNNPQLDLNALESVQIGDKEKQNTIQLGDVLFTGSSENLEDCAMSCVVTQKIEKDIYLNSFCFGFRFFDENLFNPSFLKHFLRDYNFRKNISKVANGVTRFNVSKQLLSKITIPIPPLEIQQEIVKILDAFTELNTELNTELKVRKKQYQYYQNMLLDFKNINSNHKDAKMNAKPYRLQTLLQTLAPKGVEFKKIGELFKRNKGINITAAQMKELHSDIGKVRIFAGGATKADINYKDISKKDIINCESVIIKSRGNIGFEYYNQPFSHKNEIWSYSSKTNQMLVKFLYYYLSNNQYYFQKLAQSSSVKLPQLSVSDTDEYEVPVPPLEIQQEIVKILDQFLALTTDLLAGIPAEIEARKKQYEYYREKLLAFKPLTPHKEVKK